MIKLLQEERIYEYLDENTVIERLHILHIICLKNTDDIVFFENKMLRVIEFDLSPSILRVYYLCSSLKDIGIHIKAKHFMGNEGKSAKQ